MRGEIFGIALAIRPAPRSHHSSVEATERVQLPIHGLEILKNHWERVMPAAQSRSDGSPSTNFIQHFDQAQEQAKSVFAAQKEFLDALEQINEHWFARAKSEAEFATAMASKLAAVRSMPDMTNIYQDWFGQRMQRYVEDSNHVIADVQKLIRTGSRLVQNGNGRS
jgi:putative heme degradation protein